MDLATVALAAVAGVLSTLSPCVLPILPALLAGAAAEHRFGPLALAAGLALSFTTIGIFVATAGFALGLDAGLFRLVGGALMLALGIVLLVPAAATGLAVAAGPLQTWTDHRFGGMSTAGPAGQFGLGVLLGAVWVPCVGPTLGAASLLAARGEDLPAVALAMLLFGLGAATPVLVLGVLLRRFGRGALAGLRGAAGVGKRLLGALLLVLGLLVVTGLDRTLEAALVTASPAWLTALTTRF